MEFKIKESYLKDVIFEKESIFRFAAESGAIEFPEIKECKERYFVCEMCLMEEHSGAFELAFFARGEEKPRMIMRFGLLPGLSTTLCFDMQWLDGHVLFPGNTPGALKFVCHGSRIAKEEIERVVLRSYEAFHDLRVGINNLLLTDDRPSKYPFSEVKLVDRFGQTAQKEWDGKIRQEGQLIDRLNQLLNESFEPDKKRSSFFGDISRKLDQGNGYFSTKKEHGRWHLVDPEGYAFFSMGPDCVGLYNDGRIDEVESLLEWLPEEHEPYYSWVIDEKESPYNDQVGRDRVKSISFEKINLYRAWKEDAYDNWKKLLYNQLIGYGMNSLGNWSDKELFGTIKIPYVTQLKEFPTTEIKIFRDFPDVFSEAYQEDALRCADELKKYEKDPYMIGYFLRNEPMFAFVNDLIIADEVLYNPVKSETKIRLIKFLKDRYVHIESMNKAYDLELTSFDDLYRPIKDLSKRTNAARKDMREFSREMMRTYVEVPSKACKTIDREHLNLGMRWAWISDPDLVVGWENFDVFSINCYAIDPTESIQQVENLGVDRPVMIGEFHFGALDAGPTATGLEGVWSQKDRGLAYAYYCQRVAKHPYGVGCHYFQLYDQFSVGRFDGENYNIGLFDVCSQPYKEMFSHIKESSDVIYDIMEGKIQPTEKLPKTIPMIAY